MKIDIFNHVIPKKYFDRLNQVTSNLGDLDRRMRSIPILVDMEARLRVMDEVEGYAQVICLAAPPIEAVAGPDMSPDLARVANDSMAEIVARYPDRFPGFVASLPMNNPEAAGLEIDRSIRDLKAVGVQFFTNVKGKPLDLPEFRPLFERMAGHDLPIWLHPARTSAVADYKTEEKSKYEIWWALGWPYETSVAMVRIVFAGYFDLWPNLKIITHHMGAMIPYNEGRLGPGYDVLGVRSPGEDYGKVLKSLKKRPLDYFRMFYADTALFGALTATKCGVEFFGPKNILYGTDCPFSPDKGSGYIRNTIRVLDSLPISKEELQWIYEGNARRLLRI
ncbi:MAG: amidohydrolase family protein [Thermodesulfobacteriota bacterium]